MSSLPNEAAHTSSGVEVTDSAGGAAVELQPSVDSLQHSQEEQTMMAEGEGIISDGGKATSGEGQENSSVTPRSPYSLPPRIVPPIEIQYLIRHQIGIGPNAFVRDKDRRWLWRSMRLVARSYSEQIEEQARDVWMKDAQNWVDAEGWYVINGKYRRFFPFILHACTEDLAILLRNGSVGASDDDLEERGLYGIDYLLRQLKNGDERTND